MSTFDISHPQPSSTQVWDGEREVHFSLSERGSMMVLPHSYPGAKFRISKPSGANNTLTLLPNGCSLEGGNKMVLIGGGKENVELSYDGKNWSHRTL